MEGLHLDKEEFIKKFTDLIKQVEDYTFEGIVVCSTSEAIWGRWNKGDVQMRVSAIDFIINSMYQESSEEARKSFMNALFERWEYYFGKAYEQKLVRGLVK